MSSSSQLSAAFSSAPATVTSAMQDVAGIPAQSESALQNCWEQAEVCCEQARQAATMRRLCAACGLFATALALYRHILQASSAALEERTRQKIEDDMRQVEQEMAIYEALSRSKARPLTNATAHRATAPVT